MEEKFNEATPLRPGGDRPLDAPMVSIPLTSFMQQIRQEATWHNSDRNAITVFKTDAMRIVLTALHAGAEIKTHTANGVISVQVMEGQILFHANGRSVPLGKGDMLALHQGIPHSVTAEEEAVFLLTLVTGKEA